MARRFAHHPNFLMAIYQRGDSRAIPFQDSVSDSTAYPHRKDRAIAPFMANLFWSFILLGGVLILLVRSPLHAPPFNQLTQYVCDQLPDSNIYRRSAGVFPVFVCRSDTQVVNVRSVPMSGMSPNTWKACRYAQSTIRIWRMARPSPYGTMVFHATCGDFVSMYYSDQAKFYESRQLFVMSVAIVLILLGAGMLALRLHRRHPSILRGLLTPFGP